MLATHLLRGITLLAATAALGGCDSRSDLSARPREAARDAARTAPAAPRDPCSLITKAEAEAVLGTEFTVGQVSTGGAPSCEYKPSTGKRLNGFTLTVYWTGGRDALAVTKSAQSLATGLMKTDEMDPSAMMALLPVEGLGDEAYFNPMIGSSVLKGDILLEFDIRAMMWHQTYKAGRELWQQLATKALARLPASGS